MHHKPGSDFKTGVSAGKVEARPQDEGCHGSSRASKGGSAAASGAGATQGGKGEPQTDGQLLNKWFSSKATHSNPVKRLRIFYVLDPFWKRGSSIKMWANCCTTGQVSARKQSRGDQKREGGMVRI